jgi:hypothetical protein
LRLLRDADGERNAIFLDAVALFEWAEDDRATRRLVVAQLVNAKLVTRVEVARVFGLHVNTVRSLLAGRHDEPQGGPLMIDNRATVANLFEQMQEYLPIPAFPTRRSSAHCDVAE